MIKESENIRDSRLNGLIDQIERYTWISDEKGLSKAQIEHLKELRDNATVFGYTGLRWANMADDTLIENGYSDGWKEQYTKDLKSANDNFELETGYNMKGTKVNKINEAQFSKIVENTVKSVLRERIEKRTGYLKDGDNTRVKEDGLDRNGNPKYKAADRNNKYGKKTIRSYETFVPDREDDKKKKKKTMEEIIRESLKKSLRESSLPKYEQPVFINCDSERNADASVEIGYSDYASSLFYVGECGTDCYAALETVVEWLEKNGIVDNYTDDEQMAQEYPDDYIEINGHPFRTDMIAVKTLVGNHGERKLDEIIKKSLKKSLRESAYEEDMERSRNIMSEIDEISETNPKVLAEAIKTFLNELGDSKYIQHFGNCIKLYTEN